MADAVKEANILSSKMWLDSDWNNPFKMGKVTTPQTYVMTDSDGNERVIGVISNDLETLKYTEYGDNIETHTFDHDEIVRQDAFLEVNDEGYGLLEKVEEESLVSKATSLALLKSKEKYNEGVVRVGNLMDSLSDDLCGTLAGLFSNRSSLDTFKIIIALDCLDLNMGKITGILTNISNSHSLFAKINVAKEQVNSLMSGAENVVDSLTGELTAETIQKICNLAGILIDMMEGGIKINLLLALQNGIDSAAFAAMMVLDRINKISEIIGDCLTSSSIRIVSDTGMTFGELGLSQETVDSFYSKLESGIPSIDLDQSSISSMISEIINGEGIIDQVEKITGSLAGSIVSNGGSNYTSASVNIVGKGTGAVARPLISDGKITSIVMDETGSGYTAGTTTFEILGDGVGATAIPIVIEGEVTTTPQERSSILGDISYTLKKG